jgi:hypothetical protein
MNQKLAREIRQDLQFDIKHFDANMVNRSDGRFSPKKYAYDFEKKTYVKIGKGVPFTYTADSPRKIYRNRKKNLKRAVRQGVPFYIASFFYIEKEIAQFADLRMVAQENL